MSTLRSEIRVAEFEVTTGLDELLFDLATSEIQSVGGVTEFDLRDWTITMRSVEGGHLVFDLYADYEPHTHKEQA